MSSSRVAAVLAASLSVCCSVAAAGDDAASTPSVAPAVDSEAELDEGLKRFGYLAGLARGCVVESQRVALEREVLDLHGGIARLFGIDRAFLFGTSFGYGTSVEVKTADCAEVVRNYEARVASFRARRGATG